MSDALFATLQQRLQPHEPVSDHGARQGPSWGQRDGACLPPRLALELFVRLRQAARHVVGRVQKTQPGGRQRHGAAAALDQRCACPRLQRTNASPERRVCHVAQLGRPCEAALLRQHDEVFKPFQLHRVGPC